MGTDQTTCPSCGEAVDIGAAECPHCGVNIRSGESYETRVERARTREGPASHIGRNLGFAVTVGFALLILAGFLYQQRAIKVMREGAEQYTDYIARLQQVDDLIARGEADQAQQVGEQLIEQMRQHEESIQVEVGRTTDQVKSQDRPKSIRRAEKALLRNLIEKTEYKLSQLSREG